MSISEDTLEKTGTLISFRVDPRMREAMARVEREELLSRAGVARRALVDDLRRRGLLQLERETA
jgi:hypothetical protein